MITQYAVLFDMDGLMFDTEYMYYLANKAGAERLGYSFTMAEHEKTVGTSTENFIDYIQELFDGEKETADLFMEYSNEALFDITQTEEIGIKSGLIELLDYLDEKGVQCVVASNSDRGMIHRLLRKTELDHYFEDIVGADDVRYGKPYPDLYLEAWKKTDASKEDTWILEDSTNGLKAAYAAGIKALHIPDLEPPSDESRALSYQELENLHDVKQFFQQLNK